MKIRLSTQQLQKQILTPYMQQSIELLMLPITDLQMTIEQELQNNPLLEIDETPDHDSAAEQTELEFRIDNIIKGTAAEQNYAAPTEYGDEDIQEEKQIKVNESLEESLLRQMRVEIADQEELKIGEYIIGNINEDGYLTVTVDNIADALAIPDRELIERVLEIIQRFEPIGIASRDLKECLLIQAREKLGQDGLIVSRIINNYLKELGQKKYPEIARKLESTVDEVKAAAQLITSLDPRPARNHRPLEINAYIKPDIFVNQDEETGLQVYLNKESAPVLRISPLYRDLLKRSELKQEEREFIKEKMKNALLFIKGLEQRGQTIKRIANFIVEKQGKFFTEGHVALVPMSLKDVAQALERNESTISRAINNKYISTPQGLYPIKFFFSQAINKDDTNGAAVSSRSMKESIRELINAEDKSSPLSDQDIQEHFKKEGMPVARRTISKYRQALHILPSHLRKH